MGTFYTFTNFFRENPEATESSTSEIMANSYKLRSSWSGDWKRYKAVQSLDSEIISDEGTKGYDKVLPANLDIFQSAETEVKQFKNEELKPLILKIITLMKKSFESNAINLTEKPFSKLHFYQQEDESVLLEWNLEDVRIGFSIEPDIKESSYYIVLFDRESGKLASETGLLKQDYLEEPVESIIRFVSRSI